MNPYVEYHRAPGAEAVTTAPRQSRIATEPELVDGSRICPIGAKCTLSSFQPIQVSPNEVLCIRDSQ